MKTIAAAATTAAAGLLISDKGRLVADSQPLPSPEVPFLFPRSPDDPYGFEEWNLTLPAEGIEALKPPEAWHRLNKEQGLYSSNVQALVELPKGFGVGSYLGGFQVVVPTEEGLTFGEIQIPADKLEISYIYALVYDGESQCLWLGGQGQGFFGGGRGLARIPLERKNRGVPQYFNKQINIPTIGALTYDQDRRTLFAAPLYPPSFSYNLLMHEEEKGGRWLRTAPNDRLSWLTDMSQLPDGRLLVPNRFSGLEIYDPATDTWELCQTKDDQGYGLNGACSVAVVGEQVWVGTDVLPWETTKIPRRLACLNADLSRILALYPPKATPPPGGRFTHVRGVPEAYNGEVWTATRGNSFGQVYGISQAGPNGNWEHNALNGQQVQSLEVTRSGILVGTTDGVYYYPSSLGIPTS